MKRIGTFLIISTVLLMASFALADSFDQIKHSYAKAPAVKIKSDIIVISEIFDDTDTTVSELLIADDGRYRAQMNNDLYLFDGSCVYEYSYNNAQVTVKCLKDGEWFDDQLFFIKHLDDYYTTNVIEPNSQYQLFKRDESYTGFPDSLTLWLKETRLSQIEFYDINEDLNRVVLKSDSILDKVDSSMFLINFPDSVEIIKLP